MPIKHHISALYKKILTPVVAIPVLLLGIFFVYALNTWDTGYRVDIGQVKKVWGGNGGGVCKAVANPRCLIGSGIFVPTKTDAEWFGTSGFINIHPACVDVLPCSCKTDPDCGNTSIYNCVGYQPATSGGTAAYCSGTYSAVTKRCNAENNNWTMTKPFGTGTKRIEFTNYACKAWFESQGYSNLSTIEAVSNCSTNGQGKCNSFTVVNVAEYYPSNCTDSISNVQRGCYFVNTNDKAPCNTNFADALSCGAVGCQWIPATSGYQEVLGECKFITTTCTDSSQCGGGKVCSGYKPPVVQGQYTSAVLRLTSVIRERLGQSYLDSLCPEGQSQYGDPIYTYFYALGQGMDDGSPVTVDLFNNYFPSIQVPPEGINNRAGPDQLTWTYLGDNYAEGSIVGSTDQPFGDPTDPGDRTNPLPGSSSVAVYCTRGTNYSPFLYGNYPLEVVYENTGWTNTTVQEAVLGVCVNPPGCRTNSDCSTGQVCQGYLPSQGSCSLGTSVGTACSTQDVACIDRDEAHCEADPYCHLSTLRQCKRTTTTAETLGQCKLSGICGSSSLSYFSSKPTTNLCSNGTASTVSGLGPWTWTCSVSGGLTASCTAYKTTTSSTSCLLPSTCFVKGTNVLMSDGSSKKIEDVNIGDEVLGMSGSSNKVLDFDRPSLGDRLLYSINGGDYFVTAEHPFMTLNGWKSIDPDATKREMPNFSVGILSVGDILIKDKSMDRVFTIMSKSSDPLQTLYNFKLDGNNTYYANNYLVHNKLLARDCGNLVCEVPYKCWAGNGSCQQFGGGSGAYCNTNSDCAQNYCDPNTFKCFECPTSSTSGICQPCTSTSQCPVNTYCDPNGQCAPGITWCSANPTSCPNGELPSCSLL